jgi:hypothetical protein
VIAPTTPTGSANTRELPTRSSNSYSASSLTYESSTEIGSPTWIRSASATGAPSSLTIVATASSLRSASASRSAARYPARLSGAVAAHSSAAPCAASTAASTSAGPAAGTAAITRSVAGLITSIRSLASASAQPPST